jgi:divalent metal cation (Fe/Co/Zn/Cd) transporter
VLARSSRALLLGEAAHPKAVKAISQAIQSHPSVEKLVELLTMHLAPKQILMNAHVKLNDNLSTADIETAIIEIEDRVRRAEPDVEMIFLEAARGKNIKESAVSEHIS